MQLHEQYRPTSWDDVIGQDKSISKIQQLAKRGLLETDKRLLWKLIWNMGVGGARSIWRYKKRLKQGEFFPPYLYISIINSCNLRCQGCWVDVAAKQEKIDLDALNRTIGQAKAEGNRFFGIVTSLSSSANSSRRRPNSAFNSGVSVFHTGCLARLSKRTSPPFFKRRYVPFKCCGLFSCS